MTEVVRMMIGGKLGRLKAEASKAWPEVKRRSLDAL
jgi:hypothetical protein